MLAPSTTTRAASRSTRSSSAVVARPRSRWSPRPATGPTAPSSARRCPRRPPLPRSAQVGVVRRDPMAMIPFIGYNAGDYFSHWINMGKDNDASKMPKIFYVNWFRLDEDGKFLWPGFGENSRVLKWIIERIDGQAAAIETPIGHVPAPGSFDIDGLDMTEDAAHRGAQGRRRGVEGRDPADHRVVREVRRRPADRALDRARRPEGPPRRLSQRSFTAQRLRPDPPLPGAGRGVGRHDA